MIAAASLVMSRNSWRENGAGMRHSVGVGAPDPWLLNTQTKRAQMRCKVKAWLLPSNSVQERNIV